MDKKTGEIKEIEIDKNGKIVEKGTTNTFDGFLLDKKPRKSCRHCYGRGYTGTDKFTGEKVVCNCTKNKKIK